MNSNEIVYERKMTGSFMKLRCDEVKPLDEKILLKNNIPGFLKMEKCYVNNEGQYWYDISGVQSLEMRCQYNDIKLEFLEKLVVSICNKMELLENHLVSTESLVLDPQLIHIKGVNQDEEIYFTAYPAQMKTICNTFQHLMEYMLTKLDHSDAEAIHIAYGIYEKTINGNYSIADIRNAIIEERQKKVAEKPVEEVIAPISQPQVRAEEPKEQIKPTLYDKLLVYLLEQLDIRLPERKKQASVIEKPKKPDINRKWFKKEKRKENREKAVSGDQKARDLLIEHNLRLVVYVAKRYDNSANCPLEDLISIGTIGLVKAINTFKADKNIKLATYASRCIENEILMYLRKNNKIRYEISLDEPLNIDYDGNELLLGDIVGTDDDLVEQEMLKSDQKKIFYEALKELNEREKEILILRYGLSNNDELTQKDVADLLGISQSYISRLEKKIIKKLRSQLNYDEVK